MCSSCIVCYYATLIVEMFHILQLFLTYQNTGCLQMNGTVSKVHKKFLSHLTRAQSTPSAAATVQISHALPAARLSCLRCACVRREINFLLTFETAPLFCISPLFWII